MIYQHFTLVPNLTVLENILLGFEGGFMLNLKRAAARLRSICEAYDVYIDPRQRIQELSVAEKQQTEILKILYHNSDVLILDEPGSMLAPMEVDRLHQTLKLLRTAGKSIVLITHNLKDALAVSDRITVMRSGRKTAELSGDSLKAMDIKSATDKILGFMFEEIPSTVSLHNEGWSNAEVLIELKHVGVKNGDRHSGLKDISLSIHRGEVVGLTGVAGEDQRLLAEVVGGQRQADEGQLVYSGRDITRMKVDQRHDLGIRYITAERMEEGCIAEMPLSDNAILQNYRQSPLSRFGMLRQAQIKSFAGQLIRRFAIRAAGPQVQLGMLSGGNIQKLILARSLHERPQLLICRNPTIGLDARTVQFIQRLIREESRHGAAVLLFTSDMDELFKCSNRIGVLFKGEIMGLMDRREATTDRVGKLMLGVTA
jgi:simple sugar transport system ATP-binding protein